MKDVINEKITEIEFIRVRNNSLWMDLLRIALLDSPEKGRAILKRIIKNDEQITSKVRELLEATEPQT